MKKRATKKIKSSVKRFCLENKRFSLFFLLLFFLDMRLGILNDQLFLNNLNTDPIQTTTRVPSVLYFVHGYASDNQIFNDMIQYLNQTNFFYQYTTSQPYFFDYFEKYNKSGYSRFETHFITDGISAYATDFFQSIQSNHNSLTRVDIIAHSLGGIIVREMLRLFHSQLMKNKIIINRVITLGTPHLGSKLANHPLKDTVELFAGDEWDTPIIDSLIPNSDFIRQLNFPTADYMSNINWYFVGGISLDPFCYLAKKFVFNGLDCDGFVDWRSALAMELEVDSCLRLVVMKSHHTLYNDPKQEIYECVLDWFKPNFRLSKIHSGLDLESTPAL